jgi:hypothetical protein
MLKLFRINLSEFRIMSVHYKYRNKDFSTDLSLNVSLLILSTHLSLCYVGGITLQAFGVPPPRITTFLTT